MHSHGCRHPEDGLLSSKTQSSSLRQRKFILLDDAKWPGDSIHLPRKAVSLVEVAGTDPAWQAIIRSSWINKRSGASQSGWFYPYG
jgi:hypothetical protein